MNKLDYKYGVDEDQDRFSADNTSFNDKGSK